MLGPAETGEQRESVSIAMLTLMERLSPNERVVYVLREAFGYPHGEIARMLALTESNCQQIHHRARQHLATDRVRVQTSTAEAREIASSFVRAALSGEIAPLIELLTGDAVSVADGGGQVPARSTPIEGALAIARFLRGLVKQAGRPGFDVTVHAAVVNGEPAMLAVSGDGQVSGVISLEVTPDGIAALRVQANPDKLARITRAWAG